MNNQKRQPSIVILCGSGGVGKTTLSAALAMSYTIAGKKALVITIDPAKRLATALGLETLPKEPANLSHHIPGQNTGEFYAVMPDAKDTFRSFVASISNGDDSKTQAILQTAIYKNFAQEFSGAHEYMAMETLWQMIQRQQFDVIVLDTPPSQNSKDLFLAPQLLSQFFDDGLMKWLGKSNSVAGKIFSAGLQKLANIADMVTGKGFFKELSTFAIALMDFREGFLRNFRDIQAVFTNPSTKIIYVSTPERLQGKEQRDFFDFLEANKLNLDEIFINRVLPDHISEQDLAQLTATLNHNHKKILGLAAKRMILESKNIKYIQDSMPKDIHIQTFQETTEDIHSLPQILSIAQKIKHFPKT